MTSKEIKHAVKRHLLEDLKYSLVLEELPLKEIGYIADLYALCGEGYGIEIEVKVNIEDLKRELDTIQYIKIAPGKPGGMPYKFHKHYSYLNFDENEAGVNYFSFAVPEELVDFTMRGIRNTKYGLLAVDDKYQVRCHKEANMLCDSLPSVAIVIERIRARTLKISELEDMIIGN